MTENAYKAMGSAGAASITVGIILIVTGIAAGVILLVSGGRLFKAKRGLTF